MPATSAARCCSRAMIVGRIVALPVRLEVDQHAPAVERGVDAVDADLRDADFDVGVGQQRARQRTLAVHHGAEGHACEASVMAWIAPVSWIGRKPLGTTM